MSKLSVFNGRNFHGDHSLDRGTLTKKLSSRFGCYDGAGGE